MRKTIAIVIGCLVIAVAAVAFSCSSADQTTETISQTTETAVNQLPAPGRTAPDFELVNLEGQTVSLRDYRGSPVMLNFWATWCGSCRLERPFIQQVYEDPLWQAEGLIILTVSLDESPTVVQDFMEANGFGFPVLLDTTNAVAIKYNIRFIPATLYIDENGIIGYIDIGPSVSKAEIEQRLFDLIINDE